MLSKEFKDCKTLGSDFFAGPTLSIAKELLDKLLINEKDGIICGGRIIETEAYLPEGDPACHASGNMTERNRVMYGPPGTVYVYKIYGMHLCFNIVTEPESVPAAVLIRAVEPDYGDSAMMKRRGVTNKGNLASGPGKLTMALGITMDDNNSSLSDAGIYILDNGCPVRRSGKSGRIGISKARDLKYRFFIKNNCFVSGNFRENKKR